MLDDSQIPTDRLDPLRPDQLANWSVGTAILSTILPFFWILLAVAAVALAVRAHYLLSAGVAEARRFSGGIRATLGAVIGAVALAWRSSDYLISDLMTV
ncbi:hypothetical protein [Gordonia phthalatica]|uniref:DUF4190 domain-containing protein n=1 Tax=Gordonia phthalatica TaxID=1136941 RepID=A0A0N9NEP9_9ACTN|nr:hypothetical protein [Gordonia phthalatica]ALG84061.1 hypothetical protein ACH46_05505 [Gordonia phthalatica]